MMGVALVLPSALSADELAANAETFPVAIKIDARQTKGELRPLWRFFGADEPNYSYMKHGRSCWRNWDCLPHMKSTFGRIIC